MIQHRPMVSGFTFCEIAERLSSITICAQLEENSKIQYFLVKVPNLLFSCQ